MSSKSGNKQTNDRKDEDEEEEKEAGEVEEEEEEDEEDETTIDSVDDQSDASSRNTPSTTPRTPPMTPEMVSKPPEMTSFTTRRLKKRSGKSKDGETATSYSPGVLSRLKHRLLHPRNASETRKSRGKRTTSRDARLDSQSPVRSASRTSRETQLYRRDADNRKRSPSSDASRSEGEMSRSPSASLLTKSSKQRSHYGLD